jgi:hypothetical protein
MKQRLIWLGLALMLPMAALAQPASVPGNAPGTPAPTAKPDPKMQAKFNLAAQLNVFRLSAGFNTARAIEVWGSFNFQTKWQKEVMPLFPATNDVQQLHDFFSSAVVLLGRTDNIGQGVAGFYNPWLDGLLLIKVGPGAEHPVLEDFCFIAGETWRGETVKTGDDILALYQIKEPLTITLARKYAPTVDKFNRLYPVDAPCELLPEAARPGLGGTREELAPIKGRMLYRAKMFRALFEKDNLPVVRAAKELRALLPEGDESKLMVYLSPDQNGEMLHTICQMPPLLRRNLAPNYFVKNPATRSSIMALVNSEMPRWVFAAQVIHGDDGNAPAVTMEAMDLETSAKILANLKGAK